MFKFSAEQKIFEIGGVKIGGQPGQLPTVLIGSIFYHGDKVVKDAKNGVFDKERAEALLTEEEAVSQRTGNPRFIDVVAAWPKAIVKYIDFVADITDSPFLIDGATSEVRIVGARHVEEVGLSDRAIYNSIVSETTSEEVESIKTSGIRSAVLLTLNSRNPTIKGRLDVLNELRRTAEKAGIEKCLVDTAILDIPDPGPVGKAIYLVKENYGLPAGCGAHNAVDLWNERRKLDSKTRIMSSTVANVIPISMGADFLLYGPVKNAATSYVHCAVADAYVAYAMRQEYRLRPLNREHPLFRIFR
jgi:tetrahydromethanopterin S-methyltransferase subunit H